ncbi:MAG: type 4a pilus biogenesis protein PilO [Candidatus Omnitrophota bacterium]|nr:MAG: type 4a pilus biogenesis protein PilO [Candidatus Omnitrophota bacterium]
MQISALFNFFKHIPELKLDKSKKKILLVYLLAILFVFIVYFCFVLRPSIGKLAGIIPEIGERRAAIKAVHDDLLYEGKLGKRLETLQKKLAGYEKRLSREKELPVFLENLSRMAEESRVRILGITPSDTQRKTQKDTDEKSVYQEVPITIIAQSGYHELGSFINRLETGQRYIQVSHMKIMPSAIASEGHRIEFVVYAYTFKQ